MSKVLISLLIFIASSCAMNSKKNEDNGYIFKSLNSPDVDFLLWVNKEDYSLKIVDVKNKLILKRYKMAYGKKDGDKNKEGDMKTPEGVYKITKIFSKKGLERYYGKNNVKKYGEGAIVLNYPNKDDKSKGKTGSGIWIHGVEKNERVNKRRVSKGCVVVKNEDFLEIKNFLDKNSKKSVRVVIVPNSIMQKNKQPKTIKTHKYYTLINNKEDSYFVNEKETIVGKIKL